MDAIARGWLRSQVGAAALATALALCLAAGSTAAAQEDTRAKAKRLFAGGVELYEKGEFEKALASFQEAYRLAPHPVVRVNMANCYDRMKKSLEAIFHFERFLEESDEKSQARQRKEVKEALKRLRTQVGQIRLRVVPDGASVRIDKKEQRLTPIAEPVWLAAGEHVIDVRHPDYQPVRRIVNVSGGDSSEVSVTLKRADAGAAAALPVAASASGSWDEEREAPPPASLEEELIREAEEGKGGGDSDSDAAQEVAAQAGGEDSRVNVAPLLIAGVATAALAVTTAVTGIMALAASTQFDTLSKRKALTSAERADALNAASRADDLAMATDVLLCITVVGGALTTYFFVIRNQGTASEQSASLSPWLGRDSAGIALSSSF